MGVEHLHHGELVHQVPLVSLGGVAAQRLHRHRHRGRLGTEPGDPLGGLVLPHLAEAALADLGDDFQLVPRELPLAVGRGGPQGVRVRAVAGTIPVPVGIRAAVARKCSKDSDLRSYLKVIQGYFMYYVYVGFRAWHCHLRKIQVGLGYMYLCTNLSLGG